MLIKLSKQNVKTKIIPELRRIPKDWKFLQQKLYQFTDIKADYILKNYINANQIKFDTEFANPDIKNYVEANCAMGNDFFIICDIEFSKKTLDEIEDIINYKMSTATVGGYVSLLSYYLNWKKVRLDKSYPDIFSVAINKWIQTFPYKTENVSKVIDYPILRYERPDFDPGSHGLFEGKNFLFSHPNVRFWIWK